MSYETMMDVGDLLGGVFDLGSAGVGTYLNMQQAQSQSDAMDQYTGQAAAAAAAQSQAAAQQMALAMDQWSTYKQHYLPFELQQLQSAQDTQDLYRPLQQAQVEQGLRDIALSRPLKEAQAAQTLSDMALYQPLKEAQVGDALNDIQMYAPLKRAQVQEALQDMQLYQPLKREQVAAAREDLRRARSLAADQGRQADRELELYRPLLDRYVAEAREGETPDIAGVTSRAAADVAQAFDKQRQANRRDASAQGLQPAQRAFQDRLMDVEEAAAEAAARTRAREDEVERAGAVSESRLGSALSLLAPSAVRSAPASTGGGGGTGGLSRTSLSVPSAGLLTPGGAPKTADFSGLSSPQFGLPASPLNSASSLLSSAGAGYGSLANLYGGLGQNAGDAYGSYLSGGLSSLQSVGGALHDIFDINWWNKPKKEKTHG